MGRQFNIKLSDYESFEEYVDDYMTLFKEELKEGFKGGDHDVDINEYDDFNAFLEDFFDEFDEEVKRLIVSGDVDVISSSEDLDDEE